MGREDLLKPKKSEKTLERKPERKKVSQEQATEEMIREIFLTFSGMVFDFLERNQPEVAMVLKNDFEKFTVVLTEVTGESDWSLEDLRKRIPNNMWLVYLDGYLLKLKTLTADEISEEDLRGLREDVEKRTSEENKN